MGYKYNVWFVSSWKANGEISSIECRFSDTRLYGLLKLLQTIPVLESTQTNKKSNYKVCWNNLI